MDLRNLIEIHLDVPRLAKDLDELGHPGRSWAIRQWNRRHMAVLYEAVKGFRPVSLADFVPADVPPLVQVIHDGKNSLPVFSHFEKRFCRPKARAGADSGAGTLLGYNHQPFAALTGPGYYVVRPSAEAGEVEIDYTIAPGAAEVPPGWPAITSNHHRLGRFVYDGMIDVMRGISSHVSIGRAKKKERGASEDTWFVLVREDRPPEPGNAA